MRLKNPIFLFEIAARFFLGVVFIYASWDKIRDPAAFADIIGNYQILPPALTNVAALVLPWLELVCGLCLIGGWMVRGSALVLTILLIIFMGALAYSAMRGLDIHCGCFSTSAAGPVNLYWDLLRDFVVLGIAVFLLLYSRAGSPGWAQTLIRSGD